MKAKELRQLSDKELHQKLVELRKKLAELRFHLSAGRLKNPHQIKETKKDIARILTILNERRREKEK
ncbi:50S ribosomal protein L29 [bacterium]|nr:50S ribosomal protein L29 [bacterium]HDM31966.1 50S ribosomal protein L29 [bacterium]